MAKDAIKAVEDAGLRAGSTAVKRAGTCSERDLVRGWRALALWGAPAALIVVGTFLSQAREMLWIPSFAVMGVACIVNARGRSRLHCYVMGPLLLLGALAGTSETFALVAANWKPIALVVGASRLFAYSLE